MPKQKIYNKGWRLRKAYWTAFVVVMSYLRVYFFGKLMGKSWTSRKLASLHVKNAHRVKDAILQLQGLFIKIGQLLSILSNFLPEAFQQPLEALQDKIPARPLSEIRQRIVTELGSEPEQLFAHFDETPIAAASIGQAHKALLKDGTQVVVKVQHANVEMMAEVDLTIMQNLVRLISKIFKIKGLNYAYTQVRQMIEEELDFEQEARAMQIISKNLENKAGLAIPEVYQTFSTQRVLTTTFYEGVKINQLTQIDKWGIDRTALANRLVQAYCQMVFDDRFYHADPHPGNILVQQDGTLVLLDFGAVATLKPGTRTGFLELIDAAVKNDTGKIIAALKKMGFIADDKEAVRIAEKVIAAFRNFLQNEVQFEGLSLKDIKVNPFETSLFNLISEIGIRDITETVQVPKDYVLLNRMVTLLLGICNTLDHQMNPLEAVKPYFQQFILGEKGEWVRFVTNIFQSTVANALSLPGDLHKTLSIMQKGELEVQLSTNRKQSKLYYHLVQQVVFTLLLIAAGAFGYLFYQNEQDVLGKYALGATAVIGFLLFRAIRKARQTLK